MNTKEYCRVSIDEANYQRWLEEDDSDLNLNYEIDDLKYAKDEEE